MCAQHSQFQIYLKYRVIDLGVMTPCDRIINTALKEQAGISYYYLGLLFKLSGINFTCTYSAHCTKKAS